jgi:glycosyltransferase involved in cell wall biosynthesis
MKEENSSKFDFWHKKIIAVIPACNEEKYIFDVVKKTKKYVNEVIVVDDSSNDNTEKLAKNAGAIIIKHELNLQKGAALKTGCDAALILGAEIIVILDGDGQHNPDNIPKLIEKLKYFDLVIGSRKFNNQMPKVARIGNLLLTQFARLLFNTQINDSQTGFKAFKSEVYKKIKWKSSGYEVETEIIKNITKNKISYSEVIIDTIYHDNFKGTTPIDGIKIIYQMIKWKLIN